MARKRRYKARQVVEALRVTKGMVYLAAKHLGCSHTTIYNYKRRYASVRKEFDFQRGELLDAAEIRLRDAVLSREPWAIRFCLQTLGKDRGYTQRREFSGPDGEAILIKLDQ